MRAWSSGHTHEVVVPESYSLDAGVESLQQVLDTKLEDFTSNPGINEFHVQSLLGLLNAEMLIMDHLIVGNTGYRVECALNKRNKKLWRAVPSVVEVFDAMVDLALYEPQLDTSHNLSMACQDKFDRMRLCSEYKRVYLHRAYDMLEDYYLALRYFQYDLTHKKDIA